MTTTRSWVVQMPQHVITTVWRPQTKGVNTLHAQAALLKMLVTTTVKRLLSTRKTAIILWICMVLSTSTVMEFV